MTTEELRYLAAFILGIAALVNLIVLQRVFPKDASAKRLNFAKQLYRGGLVVSAIGCLTIITAQIHRSLEVNHPPFQTIYEIFLYGCLCMGLCYLILAFVNRLHDGGRGRLVIGGLLALVAFGAIAITLGPVMNSYGNDRLELPPALQSAFFLPHVMVYIFGYGSSIVSALSASLYLLFHYTSLGERFGGEEMIIHLDTFAYRNVALSFPFLTIGLALGTAWAWYAWANYWGWDNKEVWALITWLVFLIYLHLRLVGGWRGPRSSWFIVIGGICVVFTLLLFGYLPASYFSEHKYAF
jgi:cytochrome c-type biogenesis protein CcsB